MTTELGIALYPEKPSIIHHIKMQNNGALTSRMGKITDILNILQMNHIILKVLMIWISLHIGCDFYSTPTYKV